MQWKGDASPDEDNDDVRVERDVSEVEGKRHDVRGAKLLGVCDKPLAKGTKGPMFEALTED